MGCVGLGWVGMGACAHTPLSNHAHAPWALLHVICSLPSPPSHPAASNVFSLGQTTLLKIPAVKKLLGLPDLSKLKGSKPDVGAGKPVQTFSQPPRQAAAAAPAAAEAPKVAADAGAAASKPQFATRRPAKPAQTYAQLPRQKKK